MTITKPQIIALIAIISLAGVLTASQAYAAPVATTPYVEVEIKPMSLTTTVTWDFGDDVNRDYCFSKTEAFYDEYGADGQVVEYSTIQHFFGETFSKTYDGHVHFFKASDIPDDAKIDCSGSITFPKAAISTENFTLFDYGLFMSFGDVAIDGTLDYVDEANVRISNIISYDIDYECAFDNFEYTTELNVNSTNAEVITYDKSTKTCTIAIEDITDTANYKAWFKQYNP